MTLVADGAIRRGSRAARPLDLTRPETVRAVARRVGLHTSRRLGQHFLIDRTVLETIVAELAPAQDSTVLEIGCGIGTLTGELADAAGKVIALDVDPACVRATQITQRHRTNVQVVRADARQLDPAEFGITAPWLAAGNLPYRLTGTLLGHLFELTTPPARGVFLVQREVAARLSAGPGDWSVATLALRSIATVTRVRDVPPEAFDPAPAVHSSVIRLEPVSGSLGEERRQMLALARVVFQQRRKTLRHGVAHAMGGDAAAAVEALLHARIDPGLRPGTLGLDEWQQLARAVLAVEATRP
jgi:16S rRNA (adenine1518-N6/adenine1519-N6)-dimethyltransferase